MLFCEIGSALLGEGWDWDKNGRIDAYIDAPELLDRVEGDDLLQKIIPVVALSLDLSVSELRLARWGREHDKPCQKGAW